MISVSLSGHLKLSEQLHWLAMPPVERRRVHVWLAGDLERALKRAIRETVDSSSLQHFEGDAAQRKRKARSFAGMVGKRATADEAILFDKGTGHPKRRAKNDGRATEAQALRMRELGFKLSPRQIRRRFSQPLAGYLIRKIETSKGIERRKLKKLRKGSLIPMVWREHGTEILAGVDPANVLRRYLKSKLK